MSKEGLNFNLDAQLEELNKKIQRLKDSLAHYSQHLNFVHNEPGADRSIIPGLNANIDICNQAIAEVEAIKAKTLSIKDELSKAPEESKRPGF